MSPLVSIIIPIYNRASLIIETLESINAQRYTNWECILIDDGSTDNSMNVVHNYIGDKPMFKLFERPKDVVKGANACRNYGLEKSQGVWVNWFDSDDIMHPDFILSKVAATSEEVDAVVSKTCIFKDTIDTIVHYEKRTKESQQLLSDFIALDVSWYLPDTMWHRPFLDGKEIFDQSLFMGQDRDFHTRRLIEKPNLIFVDEYLTYYRRHEISITSTFNIDKIRSFFNSLNKRIRLLQSSNLSKKAKLTMLKLQVRNYRYLYKQKGSFSQFLSVFKSLFMVDVKFLIYFIKFIIAAISFNLFNRGYFILK